MKKIYYIIKQKMLNKEFISYIIFGLITTFVNILIYDLGLKVGFDYKLSNVFALIGAKVFAYITNKIFVFNNHTDGFADLLKEMLRFIFARSLTGVIDYVGVIFLVELFKIDKSLAKYILQAVVIILNYVFSKRLVFIKKGKAKENI